MKTPYYLSRIYVSEDLRRLFKYEKFDTYLLLIGIVKRVRFQVPNFLQGTYYWRVSEYEDVEYLITMEKYFINTPCRKIVSYLPGEAATTTTITQVEGDTVLFTVKLMVVYWKKEESEVNSILFLDLYGFQKERFTNNFSIIFMFRYVTIR